MYLADLQKKYMDGYNQLMDAYRGSGIQQTVDAINRAIRDSDNDTAREYLLQIQSWNLKVMDMEDIRVSLTRLKHLHLPSALVLTVLYDEITHQWRFNTEPG